MGAFLINNNKHTGNIKMSDAIEQIEEKLAELKEVVKKRNRVLNLAKNPDFKEIILEGFVKDEAVRLTGLIGEEGFDQEGVQADLRCIAAFQRYLRRVEREGDQAEKSVADHEEMLELVRSGEYDVTEA